MKHEDYMEKLDAEDRKYIRRCEHCGWRNLVKNRWGRVICKNCRYYVYIDAEIKFKYKMKEAMNK